MDFKNFLFEKKNRLRESKPFLDLKIFLFEKIKSFKGIQVFLDFKIVLFEKKSFKWIQAFFGFLKFYYLKKNRLSESKPFLDF